MTAAVSASRRRRLATILCVPDLGRVPGSSARCSLPRGRLTRGFFGRAAIIGTLCLPALTGCEYIARGQQTTDLMIGASQSDQMEALVQAEIERRRLRSARCYSPLLTPATISAAAADSRLGKDWVDELLRDCPQLAAFLPKATLPRDATVDDGKPTGSAAPVLDPASTAEPRA